MGVTEMRKITFKWDGPKSLQSVLEIPFYRVSMRLHGLHPGNPALPTVMTFWRVDGTWLEVYAPMHDIAERSEVGVLTFEMVSSRPKDEEVSIDMEPNPFVPVDIKKLTIKDEDVLAEAGIKLVSAEGKAITVVANAFPCTLAIEGVRDDVPRIFDTAYEIDKYEIIPL